MDRNDLLIAMRVEFLGAYSKAFDAVVPLSMQRLFDEADLSPSSRDQRRLLDARSALMGQSSVLVHHAAASMDQLLNRGFRTAYSSVRPTFSSGLSSGGLSLVDSNAFEGELRVDELTQRYRNAAEEQLRDLNIRVAILFNQDDIHERENPFRPYLLSRSLMTAVEQLGQQDEIANTLIERLTVDMLERVPEIYRALNDLLAEHGIAAQLKARIVHQEVSQSPTPSVENESAEPIDEPNHGSVDAPRQTSIRHAPPNSPHVRAQSYSSDLPASLGNDAPIPESRPAGVRGRVDQLMQMIRQPLRAGGTSGDRSEGNVGSANGQAQRGDDDVNAPTRFSQTQSMSPQTVAAGAGEGFDADDAGANHLQDIARSSWLAGTEMVGNALRKFFATGTAPGMPTTPIGDTVSRRSTPLTSSVGGLMRDNTPSAEEMYGDDGAFRNLIMEMRPGLNEMAQGSNELMTIDIVAMLFEFILRDDQVPAEVRAQLGRLQFLVLKIALMDPALFTQDHHPARVLVNRIGSISVGLEKAGANTESMVAEIRQIIERLLSEEHENVGLFSKMLDEFDTFIARQLRAVDVQIERAVQAMENAENRTLQFARTSATIAESLVGLTLDGFLSDFLVNDWALAIERADRVDPIKADRYRKLIPDLIWSIAPKASKQERDQLLVQIPTILKTLREGIELIGWATDQHQALHAWLIDAHTHALRASNVQVVVPSIQQMRERFVAIIRPDSKVMSETKTARGPLNRKVLDDAIRELEVDLNLIDRVLDAPIGEEIVQNELETVIDLSGAGHVAANDDHPEADVVARLRSGVAVEINLNGKPSRARLNWISSSESSLVLSIDGDSKPAVVSVKLFLRLLKNGRAKFIEAAPLFERAVQSLLQSADQMDQNGQGSLMAA